MLNCKYINKIINNKKKVTKIRRNKNINKPQKPCLNHKLFNEIMISSFLGKQIPIHTFFMIPLIPALTYLI